MFSMVESLLANILFLLLHYKKLRMYKKCIGEYALYSEYIKYV